MEFNVHDQLVVSELYSWDRNLSNKASFSLRAE